MEHQGTLPTLRAVEVDLILEQYLFIRAVDVE